VNFSAQMCLEINFSEFVSLNEGSIGFQFREGGKGIMNVNGAESVESRSLRFSWKWNVRHLFLAVN
jgi:hypothetical protein